MNRNYNVLYIAPLLCFLLLGCSRDLDIDPTDKYSENTFWKTEAHASAGLSGCYNALYACQTWFYETDMITSNGLAYNETNGTDGIARGVHTSNTGLIVNRWTQGYRGIGRTNTFLSKVNDIQFDDTRKNRMIGEAKFLRAFFYLGLTDVFGDVPLILTAPNIEADSDLPRTPKAEIVAQIIADLNDAIAVLPVNYTAASDAGRITLGAAMALKARTQLYNERWQEAAATAKALMDMDTYRLFPNYRELFLSANERNSEVIFNVEYMLPRFSNNMDYDSYVLNRPAPTRNLADAYLMTDGKTKEESDLYDPAQPFENRDPRLHQTMYTVGYKFNGRVTAPSNVVTTGFGLKKYTDFNDNDAKAPPVSNTGQINIIFIRYAEVLLTFAEARNEASGPDTDVYAAINALRNRSSVQMPELEAGLSQEEMREVIRRERRVELAFEGLYYSDIRRWKTAEIENNGPVFNYLNIVVSERDFDPNRDYLWPIPANQVQINPALVQNPNWF